MNETNVHFQPPDTGPDRVSNAVPSLRELLWASTAELERIGLACISLVCAGGLPGAEDLNMPVYLARVKEWAAFIRMRTPRFRHAFCSNPADFNDSEPFFLMSILVQVLKMEIGVHYNPDRIARAEGTANPGYRDSRDLLIHGPLGPTLAGTCNNIPMAVVAVARELGYPVHLAATPLHVYAKWSDASGYSFNIEASNPAGMVSHPDEYYFGKPAPIPDTLFRSGCYLRPLDSAEELALCLVSRGWVLEAHGRFAEAAYAHAHACRIAPKEPYYPRVAAWCVGRWMRESYNAGVPEEHRIACKDQYQNLDLFLDPQRLLPREHLPLALTNRSTIYLTSPSVACLM